MSTCTPDAIALPCRAMTLRFVLAALHLVALGVGLGSIWTRSRALRERLDREGLRRVFAADTWWAAAAILSCASCVLLRIMSVSMLPGASALTRMPSGAN